MSEEQAELIRKVPWRTRDAIFLTLGWFAIPLITVLILATVPEAAPAVRSLANGGLTASFVYVLYDAVIAFLLLSYYLRRYEASWSDLGFRRADFWDAFFLVVGFYIGLLVLVGGAYYLLSHLLPSFNATQPQTNQFTTAAGQPGLRWVSFFALVLIPPVVEESIFRGFLFPAFSKKSGIVWGAIISSALFGLFHFQANVSVYTFILGLLLCLMYYRLKSIVPGIALHMLNNAIAYISLLHK